MKYNDQEVEEQIYDKVKNFLVTKGVKGWNMDMLAKESGLAKNTLYKIIGSKEKAIMNVILRDIVYLKNKLNNLLEASMASRNIDNIINLFSELFVSTHGEYLNEVLLEYPGSGKKVQKSTKLMDEIVIKFLKEKIEQGVLKSDCDPSIIHEMLQGTTIYFIQLGYYGDDLSKRLKISYEYLLNGIIEKKEQNDEI